MMIFNRPKTDRSAIDISVRLYGALDRLVAAEQKGTTLEDMRAAGLFAEARAARDEWENRCDTLMSVRARVARLLAQNGLAVPRSAATPWYRIRRNTDL